MPPLGMSAEAPSAAGRRREAGKLKLADLGRAETNPFFSAEAAEQLGEPSAVTLPFPSWSDQPKTKLAGE